MSAVRKQKKTSDFCAKTNFDALFISGIVLEKHKTVHMYVESILCSYSHYKHKYALIYCKTKRKAR